MLPPTVLITSATGRIGKEPVALLKRDHNFNVRACCFSEEKTDSLKVLGADEVVAFDLNHPATWDTALDGYYTQSSRSQLCCPE